MGAGVVGLVLLVLGSICVIALKRSIHGLFRGVRDKNRTQVLRSATMLTLLAGVALIYVRDQNPSVIFENVFGSEVPEEVVGLYADNYGIADAFGTVIKFQANHEIFDGLMPSGLVRAGDIELATIWEEEGSSEYPWWDLTRQRNIECYVRGNSYQPAEKLSHGNHWENLIYCYSEDSKSVYYSFGAVH